MTSLRMRVVEALAQGIAEVTGDEWELYLVEADVGLDKALDCLTENADEWGDTAAKHPMPEWRAEDWIGYGRGHDERVAARLLAVLREDR